MLRHSFVFIGKGDEQLPKRLGIIFLPTVSSSGCVTGASPKRHVGESRPARSPLARRGLSGPSGAGQRRARGRLFVSFAEKHPHPVYVC